VPKPKDNAKKRQKKQANAQKDSVREAGRAGFPLRLSLLFFAPFA
jgi:hypothetical protein